MGHQDQALHWDAVIWFPVKTPPGCCWTVTSRSMVGTGQ